MASNRGPSQPKRGGNIPLDQNSGLIHEWLDGNTQTDDDFWTSHAFYDLAEDDVLVASSSSRRTQQGDNFGLFNDSYGDLGLAELDTGSQNLIADLFPSLLPSVPSPENQTPNITVPNPFRTEGTPEHPRLRSDPSNVEIPSHGEINGLIKFRLRPESEPLPTEVRQGQLCQKQMAPHKRRAGTAYVVSYLPPDFGRNLKLDPMDSKLMRFYISAFCPGRTLLPATNTWLRDVAAMTEKIECVKHALLSLSASYVLDYTPAANLKERANLHHRKAVELLELELRKEETYQPGGGEAAVCALSILSQEDIINWELWQPRNNQPKWYRAVRAIKYILDKSDPGYRYRRPMNVQSTNFHRYMSNVQAQDDITSQVMATLNLDEADCPYPWLLEGNERDVRRINGLTGCCSKLLHTFAQITFLSGELEKNPKSVAIPLAANAILRRLNGFRQWSDLSEGHSSFEELFSRCVLDDNGLVTDATAFTDLTAESYLASAKIYLHCRLLRKPRRHDDVQSALKVLLRCTEMLPLSGTLYTAQASLFGAVIAGCVALKEDDRKVVRRFFLGAMEGPRGNVPPAWRSMQETWRWLDESFEEDPVDDSVPIGARTAWWEAMVKRVTEREGRMSLT